MRLSPPPLLKSYSKSRMKNDNSRYRTTTFDARAFIDNLSIIPKGPTDAEMEDGGEP